MENLSKGNLLDNFEAQRRPSLNPPSEPKMTWEEYITSDSANSPHIGRKMLCKENCKTFKATLAMVRRKKGI